MQVEKSKMAKKKYISFRINYSLKKLNHSGKFYNVVDRHNYGDDAVLSEMPSQRKQKH